MPLRKINSLTETSRGGDSIKCSTYWHRLIRYKRTRLSFTLWVVPFICWYCIATFCLFILFMNSMSNWGDGGEVEGTPMLTETEELSYAYFMIILMLLLCVYIVPLLFIVIQRFNDAGFMPLETIGILFWTAVGLFFTRVMLDEVYKSSLVTMVVIFGVLLVLNFIRLCYLPSKQKD